MKTLAIVSSYSESCGNAAFAKILHDSIESYSNLQVEVLGLNLQLLQSVDPTISRAANMHINDLCKKLKTFDFANIQLEAGLYGSSPSDIIKRCKKLIKANSNTTVTLHAPRLLGSFVHDFRMALVALLKFKVFQGIREIRGCFIRARQIKMNRTIIKYAIKRKCRLIVHTQRAKEQIGIIYNYHKVDVHPLKMVPEQFKPHGTSIQQLRQALSFKEDDILIGVFGFISAYKGHVDAINAIRYLPPNYKLLVFGRQHPQTITSGGKVDRYLESLIKLVTTDHADAMLQDRVFFMGELADEEFLDTIASIDLVWLPYYENGQDGSGIASICMDLASRVICSTSFAFDELFKLIPYENYLRFDIGNTLELAHKTKAIMHKIQKNTNAVNNTYTIKSQVEIYTKDLVTV